MNCHRCFHVSSTACLLVAVCVTQSAFAQTSTKTISGTGGTGFSGTIGGDITATVKAQTNDGTQQTRGLLNIRDLDLDIFSGSVLIPSQPRRNFKAVGFVDIAETAMSLSIPSTPFSSSTSLSAVVTAGDNLRGNQTAGSDGAWDDPGRTGILNNATLDSFSATLNEDVTATASATGGLSASLQNDIRLREVIRSPPTVVVDLRIKKSSSISIEFADTQNISLKNLTISSFVPIALGTPESNFVESSHPTGVPQLDLSASGFVETQISGTISADLLGTVSGSIDIAADATILGIFSPDIFSANGVINGALSDPNISLFSLNEGFQLGSVDLPFAFSVKHEPTTDLSFDDVTAALITSTFGIEFPLSISEELVLTLPTISFELGQNGPTDNPDFRFDFDVLGSPLTMELEHLQGEFTGQLVLDLQADLAISANMLAEAFEASAINTTISVPEPSGTMAMLLAVPWFLSRRSRLRKPK